MSSELAGKRALVTGASRGIGFGAARALEAAGAEVLGVSASSGDFACDFGDREAVYSLLEQLPDIDILVLNAGTIERRAAVDHGDELWDHVLEVNLTAPFVLARALGRKMVERGSGKIVFVASLLSFQGGITVPSYAASKGGVAQLTKALANEWAPYGVNVNAIAPGYIATDNTRALRDDPERAESILARIPAGRWGTPDDLAGAFVFLASPASDYVHGVILNVDGGWLAR
jgi:2-dehydro-3-deoxy-D-gluconate 5-dehydrogenase